MLTFSQTISHMNNKPGEGERSYFVLGYTHAHIHKHTRARTLPRARRKAERRWCWICSDIVWIQRLTPSLFPSFSFYPLVFASEFLTPLKISTRISKTKSSLKIVVAHRLFALSIKPRSLLLLHLVLLLSPFIVVWKSPGTPGSPRSWERERVNVRRRSACALRGLISALLPPRVFSFSRAVGVSAQHLSPPRGSLHPFTSPALSLLLSPHSSVSTQQELGSACASARALSRALSPSLARSLFFFLSLSLYLLLHFLYTLISWTRLERKSHSNSVCAFVLKSEINLYSVYLSVV